MGYLTETLEQLFPDYVPISRAPTFEQLVKFSNDTRTSFDKVMQTEELKRYSSVMEKDGKKFYYAIQNPAVMSYQAFLRKPIKRQKPLSIKPDIEKTKTKQLPDSVWKSQKQE